MGEATYEAMRAYIRAAAELEVSKAFSTRSTPTVLEGPPGPDGKDGVDGKAGRDGVDGKDGERGAHGIATREELDSLIEQRFADVQARSFADIYRGVYKDGEQYTRGQVVTWGGSLWLAKAETRAKPGTSQDFQLIVKAGRDGK